MWAAVPAAAACDALAGDEDDAVPLGPGQLPPRNATLPPLHAEINISIIMVKGQLELEVRFIWSLHLAINEQKQSCIRTDTEIYLYQVSHARRVYGVNGEVPDSYVKCYLRDGDKWLLKRKTRVVRRTTEPHFKQTLKYQVRS